MTVGEIFAQYKIMPILQLHQLRVAAVGKMLSGAFKEKLDTRSIILACLFHDMGNIIKFDLAQFPESLQPEGLQYWEKVKEDFIRRFGPDEHHATIAIGHELDLPLQVMKYIEGVGFSKLEHIARTPSFEQKIVEYADCRVAPTGVISMDERLEEARVRYAKRRSDMPAEKDRYDALIAAAHQIEKQIFSNTSTKPEDITDAAVQPLIDELRNYSV